MKVKATLDKQIVIHVKNHVGALAKVTEIISTASINMIAICAYAVDNKGTIMFVSENNTLAKDLLKKENFDVREEEVILVAIENVPGALQTLTQRIANVGIDVTLLYGSVNKKGKMTRLVLISEFNNTVLTAIRTL